MRSAHRHTELPCVENDKNALRTEPLLNLPRNIFRQPLLQLWTLCHACNEPRENTKPRHTSCVRTIDNMCRPKEREQVVLTDRVKGNGSNGDESVRLLRQHIRPEILRTHMQPCKSSA